MPPTNLATVPDILEALGAIDWSAANLSEYSATLQAVCVKWPAPLDRGMRVRLIVDAEVTFVGVGIDGVQKSTLKAVDARIA